MGSLLLPPLLVILQGIILILIIKPKESIGIRIKQC